MQKFTERSVSGSASGCTYWLATASYYITAWRAQLASVQKL